MASKQSDRELLLRALFTTEPYRQAKLVFEIPPDVQLLDVVNYYRAASWPNEKIRCAVCHAARHRDGLTVLLSNGNRALMGSRCGEKHFGVTFRKAAERLELKRDRQHELRMLLRFRVVARDLVAAVHRWDRPVRFLEARRITFERYLTPLHAALRAAHVRDDDALMKTVKLKNHAPRPGEGPFTFKRQPVYRIRGGKLFDPMDLVRQYEAAAGYVKTYRDLAMASGTEQWATMRLSTARRKLEGAIEKLAAIQEICDATGAFFEPGNLKAIRSWAHEELPRLELEVQGREFVEPSSGARIGIEGVPDPDPVLMELVAEWRRAE